MRRFYEISCNSTDEAIDKLLEESKDDNWGGGSCEDSLDDAFYERKSEVSDEEGDFYDEDEDYEREMCD